MRYPAESVIYRSDAIGGLRVRSSLTGRKALIDLILSRRPRTAAHRSSQGKPLGSDLRSSAVPRNSLNRQHIAAAKAIRSYNVTPTVFDAGRVTCI